MKLVLLSLPFILHPSAFILLGCAVAFGAARARGARRRAARGCGGVRARRRLRRTALRAGAGRRVALRLLLLAAADAAGADRRLSRRAALAREVDADDALELVQERGQHDRLRRARK